MKQKNDWQQYKDIIERNNPKIRKQSQWQSQLQ